MTFTPPLPQQPRWATYIPDRNPNFKMHSDIGKAKNALGYAYGENDVRPGLLYEYVEGEWIVRHEVKPEDKKSTHPLWKDAWEKKHQRWHQIYRMYLDEHHRAGTLTDRELDARCDYCREPRWKLKWEQRPSIETIVRES